MADSILVDIIGNVLSSLGSYAIQQIGLPCGVKGELRKMETNFSAIKKLLLDAAKQQMSNCAEKEWLETLKFILYDAEDLLDELDEFATETKKRQVESLMRKVHYFFTSSNPLVFRYVVGRKIRDIGKRLDEIVLQMNALPWLIQINRREETSPFLNTVRVIGRDADKEKLVWLLLSSCDEENVAIIPIVGMGGLGKTTLAQLVYNDDRIQNHFTKRLWVSVSNDFDVRKILIQLLQVGDLNGGTSYSNEGLEQLQNRVRDLLRKDKFILFLDDVWNEDCVEWKKLEDLLITQARGSRIVVTTRSKTVASIVRTSTVEPYELRGNDFLTIKGAISQTIPETVRHVSFHLNTYCSFPRPLMEAKKLRTIIYPSNTEHTLESPVEPAIASFRSLRVLEGLRLPKNIGKLKFLRYISINAPYNLPNSLCMLLHLQYLDLSRSYVCGLPEDFYKLIKLRFLALRTTLTRLPKEGIGRLISLRTLFFYRCDNLESLGEGIEHLPCLRDLALLSCSKLVSLPAGFRHLERLEIDLCKSLNLSEDDDLKGLISLKKLGLIRLPRLVNLPKGLLDAAATLTHLEIGGCENFTSPSESVLPNLLSLQSLTIWWCHKVASLPKGMQRLTKLQDLRICHCGLNYTSRYREGGEDWHKIAHVAAMNCLLSYVCSALLLCVVMELEFSGRCVGAGVLGDGRAYSIHLV
ncbi:hypothetical protein RHGRI_006500 [Rhododendron griersonianum]|uniref:Uncharacterized protein n=1 Tax=Rhododendron griersonianum TaxID=479676 RepID=A0AAV6KUP2_9ERIC|nr:hypothetical protein RHGRI_006500 [Rhododendron griersonianum]